MQLHNPIAAYVMEIWSAERAPKPPRHAWRNYELGPLTAEKLPSPLIIVHLETFQITSLQFPF